MSEYWVSKKMYFCKYCDIYIADDAPSRQQHENGLRHKGNVERFIRGIYKTGEKQKKDREEEKRDMMRIEQAAVAAFAQDVGAGLAKPGSSSGASTPVAAATARKPAPKPSNPYANYSTAQSLGYSDPDADRIAAELEMRRLQGAVGQWEVVTPPTGIPSVAAPDTEHPDSTSEVGIKRDAEAPVDEEDARAFKLRKKTVSAGLGEIYDPGLILIKIKKKEPKMELEESKLASPAVTQATASDRPKWTPTHWKRTGDGPSTEYDLKSSEAPVKQEAESALTAKKSSKWAKPQWSQPLPGLKQEERQLIFGAEDQQTSEDTSETKTEPVVKTEADEKEEESQTRKSLLADDDPLPSSSLFKKRKTPAGATRGRRDNI